MILFWDLESLTLKLKLWSSFLECKTQQDSTSPWSSDPWCYDPVEMWNEDCGESKQTLINQLKWQLFWMSLSTSPSPKIKHISPLHKLVLITCTSSFQTSPPTPPPPQPQPQQQDNYNFCLLHVLGLLISFTQKCKCMTASS